MNSILKFIIPVIIILGCISSLAFKTCDNEEINEIPVEEETEVYDAEPNLLELTFDPIEWQRTQYHEQMVQALINKNEETLTTLIEERNEFIDDNNLSDIKLTDAEELFDLCRLVSYESGDQYTTDHHIEMVISVILNRLRCTYFPNTISKIIWQKGQYATVYSKRIDFYAIEYSDRIAEIVVSMLDDHRVCPANVVFQANFSQGSGTYETISVEQFKGTSYYKTYFCFDNYWRDCYNDDPYVEP